jgi:hypothetical protein
MAAIQITIRDTDLTGVAVDVGANPEFPSSGLLYTNAQMLSIEVLKYLQQLANQFNSRTDQAAVNDAILLGTS